MERRCLGNGWSYNTLERAARTGQRTYARTLARKVEWPQPVTCPRPTHVRINEDPLVYTTLDQAFSAMMTGLSQSSKQCKRYHRSNPPLEQQSQAVYHCKRFHTQSYTNSQRFSQSQKKQSVDVQAPPGEYDVSVSAWGSDKQQTYHVHVDKGEAVELDFVL